VETRREIVEHLDCDTLGKTNSYGEREQVTTRKPERLPIDRQGEAVVAVGDRAGQVVGRRDPPRDARRRAACLPAVGLRITVERPQRTFVTGAG
jgi:hypothetical protein